MRSGPAPGARSATPPVAPADRDAERSFDDAAGRLRSSDRRPAIRTLTRCRGPLAENGGQALIVHPLASSGRASTTKRLREVTGSTSCRRSSKGRRSSAESEGLSLRHGHLGPARGETGEPAPAKLGAVLDAVADARDNAGDLSLGLSRSPRSRSRNTIPSFQSRSKSSSRGSGAARDRLREAIVEPNVLDYARDSVRRGHEKRRHRRGKAAGGAAWIRDATTTSTLRLMSP